MERSGKEFIERAVHHLREEYLPRIERASSAMPREDLWWCPHRSTNSVGNLLLHLEGNVRQWILHGLGGQPDGRDRDAEFRAEDGATRAQLLAELRGTVEDACAVIEALDDRDLLGRRRIQGFETSGLAAVLHVVEHFSWHCGQIVWIAKLRAGVGHEIAFYDDRDLQSPSA